MQYFTANAIGYKGIGGGMKAAPQLVRWPRQADRQPARPYQATGPQRADRTRVRLDHGRHRQSRSRVPPALFALRLRVLRIDARTRRTDALARLPKRPLHWRRPNRDGSGSDGSESHSRFESVVGNRPKKNRCTLLQGRAVQRIMKCQAEKIPLVQLFCCREITAARNNRWIDLETESDDKKRRSAAM